MSHKVAQNALSHQAGKHLVSTYEQLKTWLIDDMYEPATDYICDWLFEGIPEHYPFKKKLMIFRANSKIGDSWDVFQLILVVLTGVTYAYTRYSISYIQTYIIFLFELIITQFFLFDFLLNWYLAISMFHFFIDPMTMIDVLTMMPVYITLFTGLSNTSINFFRCLRIVRLMRMFRTVKAIKNLNPVRRQVVNMVVTLMSMIYLAGSVVQLMEDDIFQLTLNCSYINSNTGYNPSCSAAYFTPDDCDCDVNNCVAVYFFHDSEGQPSGIRCNVISFYESIYFVVVTMATVGYGDYYPVTDYGRIVVIIFIIGSLVVIPTRLTELQRLLSMRSPYSMPYVKAHATDKHVIVCGHVNNSQKLERFFQEFFHEDHATIMGNEYHCVILSAKEPPEDVRSLLSNPLYDNKVSFIVGSALDIDDLKKSRCDIASCMFFLADMKADDSATGSEDAATVLRALSVSNFNHELTCLVQVLRPEERVILKDSDISVILCLEEYKTALQARNAVCPGFSTIVENLFHSIETISDEDLDKLDIGWYREYLHGASLELYLMQLPKQFIMKMRYNYHRIVEGVYLKYNVVMLGLTCDDNSSIIFNPSRNDMDVFKHMKGMFKSFNIALVMAEDQHIANEISKELNDPDVQDQILHSLEQAEKMFPCRGRERKDDGDASVAPVPKALSWTSKKGMNASNRGLGMLQEDAEDEEADSDDDSIDKTQQMQDGPASPATEERNNASNVTGALQHIMQSTLNKQEKNRLIALCSSVDNNVAAVINALATPNSPMDDDTLRSILTTHAPSGAVPSDSIFGNVVQSITNSNGAFNFLKTPAVFPASPEKGADESSGDSGKPAPNHVTVVEDIDTDDLSSDANGFSESDLDSDSEHSGDDDDEEQREVGAHGSKRKRYIGYKVVKKLKLPLSSPGIVSRKSAAPAPSSGFKASDGASTTALPAVAEGDQHARLSGSSASSAGSGPATSTPTAKSEPALVGYSTPVAQKELSHSVSLPLNDPNNPAWSQQAPRSNLPPHRLAPLGKSGEKKPKKALFSGPSDAGPPLVLLSAQLKVDETGTPIKRPISAKGFRRIREDVSQLDESKRGTDLDEVGGLLLDDSDRGYSSAPPVSRAQIQLPRPGQRPLSAHSGGSTANGAAVPMRPKSAGPTSPLPVLPPSAAPPAPTPNTVPASRVSIAELMNRSSYIDSNDESKETESGDEDEDDFVKNDSGGSSEEEDEKVKSSGPVAVGRPRPGLASSLMATSGTVSAKQGTFGPFSLTAAKAEKSHSPSLEQRVASPFTPASPRSDYSLSESSCDSDYESSEGADDLSVEDEAEDEEVVAGRAEWEREYGRASREIKSTKIRNHVILFGCDEHLPMFISELRREAVTGDSYHPILIIAEVPPIKWTSIMNRYNDIYYLRGDISSLEVFSKVNIDQAYSLIIMNVGGSGKSKQLAVVKSPDDAGSAERDEESMDAVTLFTYLKLEQYIPLNVFCSVELNCTTNMAVMNATIMRRARARQLQESTRRGKLSGVYTGLSERRRSSPHSLNDDSFGARRNSVDDSESQLEWFMQAMRDSYDGILACFTDNPTKEEPPPPIDIPVTPPMGTPTKLRKKAPDSTPAGSLKGQQVQVAMVPVGDTGRRKSAFGSLGVDDLSTLTHTSAAQESKQAASSADESADISRLQRGSSQRVRSVDLGSSFYSKFLWAFKLCGYGSGTGNDDPRAPGGVGMVPGAGDAQHHKENKLWDALTTHHMLPVFAAAKAFVPTSFESLLVQSFYLSLTPVICEKLVCGQVDQIIIQIPLPAVLDGHPFVNLFRLFMNYKVLCLGLYRSANDGESGALLSYVFLAPLGGTVLRAEDRVFLYGTVKDTDNAIKFITDKLSDTRMQEVCTGTDKY